MSANVIKLHLRNGQSRTPIVKRAVHDASLEARNIIAKATNDANEIIANAQREKDAIVEESRTRGYNEGLERWNETLTGAWKARDEYLSKNEMELVRLAAAIARKIVGDCSQTDPHALIHTAREAIRAVRSDRRVRLLVRPADETVVRERMSELQEACADTCDIVVIADSSIAIGGCIVESDVGTIDAQFDTQLASLERALMRGVQGDGQ